MTRRPPRGRRPGDPEVTRQSILDAARAEFTERGYDGATIRGIAAGAGVDPALVHHHFGTKEDLFVAAHGFPIRPAALEAALRGSTGSVGERLARAYLPAVLESDTVEALVRSAASSEAARTMLREFVQTEVLDPLEGLVGGPDGRFRMALAAAQLVGVVMLRRIAGIDALAGADVERIVAAVAPVVDHHLARAGAAGQHG